MEDNHILFEMEDNFNLNERQTFQWKMTSIFLWIEDDLKNYY
jgi:hypothetical protein